MSFAYLKGMRTRSINLIAKELEKTKGLFTEVYCTEDNDLSTVRRKVSTTLTKLREYSSKLESTCEKLAVKYEDIEDRNSTRRRKGIRERINCSDDAVIESVIIINLSA